MQLAARRSCSTTAFCACLTRQPGDRRVGSPRRRRSSRVRRRGAGRRGRRSPRVGRSSSRHHVTSVMSPNVQIIAMPVPLSGSASWWATIGHLDAVQRRAHGRAEQRLVARVVGVGDERDARREQLGPGGVDDDRRRRRRCGGTRSCGRRRALPVLHLGLGDGGAEVDVPQRRRVLLYASPRARLRRNARWLARRAAVVDGRVEQRSQSTDRPRRRNSSSKTSSSSATSSSHSSTKFGRDDRHGVVVLRRVAAERRLEARRRTAATDRSGRRSSSGPGARWQAVVVPADRVEDLLAAHALEAGDGVGVGVAEHVADVQRAADGRRRRVDGEHLVAGGRAVEAVGAVGVPLLRPSGPRCRRATACRGCSP